MRAVVTTGRVREVMVSRRGIMGASPFETFMDDMNGRPVSNRMTLSCPF